MLHHHPADLPPDVQKWLPIVAAAESSRDQTPKNHELLIHWASVVDIE